MSTDLRLALTAPGKRRRQSCIDVNGPPFLSQLGICHESSENKVTWEANKDVYIFVHDYMVDFENPLLVASEFWYFLGYNGAFIAFSWPTAPKTVARLSDIETAIASARSLRNLVIYIGEQSQADRIHNVTWSKSQCHPSRQRSLIAFWPGLPMEITRFHKSA